MILMPLTIISQVDIRCVASIWDSKHLHLDILLHFLLLEHGVVSGLMLEVISSLGGARSTAIWLLVFESYIFIAGVCRMLRVISGLTSLFHFVFN